eukprot:TRINITY_DN3603_c0_g1_i1.p2 TRINITY_DN3603_c0_g1~~TRINITY_DN3603_c0_g1_i1.p2  ORF type:complete len:104 (+),score=16.55 TRINITY_DN3603_c0_g1_i1:119-430(+)
MAIRDIPLTNFQFLYDSFHRSEAEVTPSGIMGIGSDGVLRKFEHDRVSKNLDEELSRCSQSESPAKFALHVSTLSESYEENKSIPVSYILSFYSVAFAGKCRE